MNRIIIINHGRCCCSVLWDWWNWNISESAHSYARQKNIINDDGHCILSMSVVVWYTKKIKGNLDIRKFETIDSNRFVLNHSMHTRACKKRRILMKWYRAGTIVRTNTKEFTKRFINGNELDDKDNNNSRTMVLRREEKNNKTTDDSTTDIILAYFKYSIATNSRFVTSCEFLSLLLECECVLRFFV